MIYYTKLFEKGMTTLDCFDVHAHIFPDKIAGKVVCALEEYYNFKWQGDASVGDLLAAMDDARVKKAVIFSCATKPEQVIPVNDFLIAIKNQYPERFIALGTLHPDLPEIGKEIERIKASGLKGIKFHPDFQHIYIDEPAMMRVYEKLDDSLPLMIHLGDYRTDFSSPYRLAHVLDEFPQLTVIAAHFGGYSEWDQAWKHLVGRNVYFDTSSSIFKLGAAEAAKIVRAHGADKILFASDYPACRHQQAIDDVLAMKLSENENRLIFSGNAERIFGK